MKSLLARVECNRPQSWGEPLATRLVAWTFSQVLSAFTSQVKDRGFDPWHDNLVDYNSLMRSHVKLTVDICL